MEFGCPDKPPRRWWSFPSVARLVLKRSGWAFSCWDTKHLQQNHPGGTRAGSRRGNRRIRSEGSLGRGMSQPESFFLSKEEIAGCAWPGHWCLKEASPRSPLRHLLLSLTPPLPFPPPPSHKHLVSSITTQRDSA